MNNRNLLRTGLTSWISVACLTLGGCFMGPEQSLNNSVPDEVLTISGSVGDGPTVGADITIFDANGNIVTSTTSDSQARYSFEVADDVLFPLSIESSGGTNLVTGNSPEFTLEAVALDRSRAVANLSAWNTVAVKTAACMPGGISSASLDSAVDLVAADLGMGLDPGQTGNPIYATVDSSNIAQIVLANEALSESIHRTVVALSGTSSQTGAINIVSQLACDLSDGQLDGVGSNVDPRVIVSFVTATAGVLLEVESRQLRINGSVATSLMNDAIRAVLPSSSNIPSVTDVAITDAIVTQTLAALHVSRTVSSDVPLVEFVITLEETPISGLSAAIGQSLDANALNMFALLPLLAAMANNNVIDSVLAVFGLIQTSNSPTLTLSATAMSVPMGSPAELTWSSGNADRCLAYEYWSGEKVTSGTFTSSPLTVESSFRLSCVGYGGSVTQNLSVALMPDDGGGGEPPPPGPPPPTGTDYARGVPFPDFGWDPLTFDAPVTRTTSSFPATINSGEIVLYTGTSSGQVTFNCSAAAPCMLKGQGQTLNNAMRVSGSHFVLENFAFFNGDTSVTASGSSSNRTSFAAIRRIDHGGNNTGTSNGTSMSLTFAHDIVYYQNSIHNLKDDSGTSEVDYIGFVPRHEVTRIWYLDNDVYRLGGDSIRTGTNVSRLGAGLTPPTNIYLARNRFHDNGENPIDLKYSTDIVISANELYGVDQVVSSSGEAIVLHESADRVSIYDNIIRDVNRGIVTATSGGGANYILVDGNTFQDIEQYGVYNRGGGHADIVDNLFRNVVTPIQNNTNNGSTVTMSGNIFE